MRASPQGSGFTCRSRRSLSLLVAGALGSALLPVPGAAQGMPPLLAQFLQRKISLTEAEIDAAAGGKPVVKVLEPADRRMLTGFGIVRIEVPRSFYVSLVTDFPPSLRDSTVLRLGAFSNPASVADLAGFTLSRGDVQELSQCHPGSCKLKLPASAMADLRGVIDTASPAADSVATAYFRKGVVDYVTAYRLRGNVALVVYDDRQSPTAAALVLDSLLAGSPEMFQYAPGLERYLENYPHDRPPGVEEALFWAQDDLPGLRPTFVVSHRVVYTSPDLPGTTLIASKQLYAEHYLDGALGLTALVDEQDKQPPAQPGLYLVYLRQLHFDNLPSGGVVNLRHKVIGKLRERTAESLRQAKQRCERAYAARPASAP